MDEFEDVACVAGLPMQPPDRGKRYTRQRAAVALARLVRRDGLVPDMISAEDIVRCSSEQIRELTMFVHEVEPEALVTLLRGSRGRSAPSRHADTGLDRAIHNRRSERS